MKVEYINPFIKSTIETFEAMMELSIKPGKPKLKTEPFPMFDVSGIIGVSGSAQGSVALSFPKTAALKIVSRFTGVEVKIVGPELVDAIGEIANIVTGSAKQHLSDMRVDISLPNVVIGKEHMLSIPRNAQCIIVPFSTELGDFVLEVSLKTP